MGPSSKRLDPVLALRRRRMMMVGLAAFLIVDIGLVALALNPPLPDSDPVAAAPVRIKTPTPTPEPVETPEPPAVVKAVLPTRILTARDDALAWRATTGPCPGTPALPERTEDAGASWMSSTATGPTGVLSLQSIMIEGRDIASMVGQSPVDCSPMFVRTHVAGANYAEYPADLRNAWFVHPLDRAVVHSPGGDFAAPCANVLAIAAHDGNRAAVLCDDQSVYQTTDAAISWPVSASILGAMNLAASSSGYLVAAVGAPDCAGVEVLTLPELVDAPTVVAESSGCLPVTTAPDSLAGNIALSEASGMLWLWAGDIVARSEDGGSTWL